MGPHAHSRREVLASLGGIGVAGAIGGAGTHALLSDGASGGGGISAGTLSVSDGDGSQALSFSVRNIDRGQGGEERLGVVVDANPAWLWLRSRCPPPVDPLGDALRVTLRWDGEAVNSGTLSDIQGSLARGELLGGACTGVGETPLEFEWYLPIGTPDSVAGSETHIAFELFAEQCRHNDARRSSNPFAGAPDCDERRACVPCEERIAGARFEYDGPYAATVELLQRQNGGSPKSDYAFADLEPGDTFVTGLPTSGRADIDVVVDGTRVGDFHVSCSRPFGPRLVVGDGTHSLTVLAATDTDGNAICEVDE